MRSVIWKLALCVVLLGIVLVGGIFTRGLGTYQALILMIAPWMGWALLALARRRSNDSAA